MTISYDPGLPTDKLLCTAWLSREDIQDFALGIGTCGVKLFDPKEVFIVGNRIFMYLWS